MKVSVFIPCYNAERYIEETLLSILNQTYRDFQIIVIDDGSTDKSAKIVEEYREKDSRIKLLYNKENKGIAYTRNRGIQECDTEFIAIMDADDIAPLDRLEKEVSYLEKYKNIGAVGGQYILIDEKGNLMKTVSNYAKTPLEVKALLFLKNIISNSSVMYRRNVVIDNHLKYLDGYYGLEDYRFWVEFANVAQIVNLPDVLLYYRVVNTGLSKSAVNQKLEERNECFDQIHRYAFSSNKFKLSMEDEDFLLPILRECGKCSRVNDWLSMKRIKRKIIKQAEKLNKPYTNQLQKAFLKEFRV